MAEHYDVFLSYAHADAARVRPLVEALEAKGLEVWFDDRDIADFEGITRSIEQGLARSKALLAYYSHTYPGRRPCQWELTAAFLAAERDGDPRRRLLVINPESHAEHIEPVELRDARFRQAPDDLSALGVLAESVRDHVGALGGPLGELRPLAPAPTFGQQLVGSTRFVGRLSELWRVHSALQAGEVGLITGARQAPVAQLRGLGGVGKSLLAEEYALRFGAAYPGGVFWLRAFGNDDAKADLGPEGRAAERDRQLRDFAAALGVAVEDQDPAAIEVALARAIERQGKPCLWVVDDVPSGLDGEELRRFFAPHRLAKTLLTTRSREYGALAAEVDLGLLPPDDAYELLTSQRTPLGDAEAAAATGLVEDLGSHAQALDVAGAALGVQAGLQSFADFRAALSDPTEDELELARDLADALPNGHEPSIAATLARSVERLEEEARDFLRLASLLAVAPVPARLVADVFAAVDALKKRPARKRAALALHQAESLSLSERADAEGARQVHTLVSRTVRFTEDQPKRREALRQAAVELLTAQLGAVFDIREHVALRHAVAHARALVQTVDEEAEAQLLGLVTRYDYERGEYRSAELSAAGCGRPCGACSARSTATR